ncbi:MAG: Fic family protein [Magnetococcales bacterium]|nr:Fic family protein [Magnetococcales bacterium]
MPTANENLAVSLKYLQKLQKNEDRVFQSHKLTRVHRERLVRQGFLKSIMDGWLVSWNPGTTPGDTTQWYVSFWEFCAKYSNKRFGSKWHLSPVQSLLLHAENTIIPQQVIIYTTKGSNNKIPLLFGTSLYDLKQKAMPFEEDLIVRAGLPMFTIPAALIKAGLGFFTNHPVEAQVVLASIHDASDLLRKLIDGGHSTIAGHFAGAFRSIGKADIADEILTTMKRVGYDVRERDPFAPQQIFSTTNSTDAPIVNRLRTLWETFRTPLIEMSPGTPGQPLDKAAYLSFIDDIYVKDAYHSLSIEGYRVTDVLIERVRSGVWDPENSHEDSNSRDALAARGYWQAFQLVKQTVAKVINGESSAELVRLNHRDWYRELFQPCVDAGLVQASILAGYRNQPVYLRGSRHIPPRWQSVQDAIPTLFNLLAEEQEPFVRAVLGHWLFGYIHPYPDGNGRIARFMMNVMLASGGYPWTIMLAEDRSIYLAALEAASVENDIKPFARYIADRVQHSTEEAAAKTAI